MADAPHPAPHLPTPAAALDEATVTVGGQRWRLRRGGTVGAPWLLLIHGTGSSGASWAPVAAALAGQHALLLPDLPGHGGSAGFADGRASLPRMAQALAALLQHLGVDAGRVPLAVAGHSAGAAVMLQLALDAQAQGAPGPRTLLAMNGALAPLPGWAGQVGPPLARLLARQPWLPPLAAWQASREGPLQRLIASTGSRLGPEAVAHYRGLLSQPAHVQGALSMMAHWSLDGLLAALPRLRTPLWLAAGTADATVPARQSERLASRLQAAGVPARYRPLPGLGHLAQEEAPAAVAALLQAWWAQTGATAASGTAAEPVQPCAARTAAES